MGRLRKDYALYRRRCKDGTRIWYYRTYDQYGQRTAGRTIGQTNKTRAERSCNSLLRTGELVPIKETVFGTYAQDWWVWDKCAYIRGRLARSASGRPTISERHAGDMRSALENHILPVFRTSRLSSIKPQLIESWMFDLADAMPWLPPDAAAADEYRVAGRHVCLLCPGAIAQAVRDVDLKPGRPYDGARTRRGQQLSSSGPEGRGAVPALGHAETGRCFAGALLPCLGGDLRRELRSRSDRRST